MIDHSPKPEEEKAPESNLYLSSHECTRPSDEHRNGAEGDSDGNQDHILADAENGVYILCDGMGGLNDGEAASRDATESLQASLLAIQNTSSVMRAKEKMQQALEAANEAVNKNKRPNDPDNPDEEDRRGTTATALKIVTDGVQRTAIIGHIGDSRIYLRRDGVLTQLTEDHGALRALKIHASGKRRLEDDAFPEHMMQMTVAEIEETIRKFEEVKFKSELEKFSIPEQLSFSYRHTIAPLGRDNPEFDILAVTLQPDDELFMTSDGVTDNLTIHELRELTKSTVTNKAQMISDASYQESQSPDMNDVRAKPDDISILEVKVEPTPQEAEILKKLDEFEEKIGQLEDGDESVATIQNHILLFIQRIDVRYFSPKMARKLINAYKEAKEVTHELDIQGEWNVVDEIATQKLKELYQRAEWKFPEGDNVWWASRSSRDSNG